MIFISKFYNKSVILFLILISLFNCTKSVHQTNSVTADFHYTRGLECLKLNDTENAEREFRFAIELDDHFAPAHLGLAILNYNNADYSVSEHHADEAIKLKKYWADAYLLKGKILFQKEKYDQAIKILNQAEDIFTKGNSNKRENLKSEIFLWRGLCLKNIGNNDMAAIELAAALKLDPDNQIAGQTLDDIRLISELTAAYPQSVKDIINKKAITRADWAELLISGLTRNSILNKPFQISDKTINLPDVSNNEIIIRALQRNLVNIYPDGEFKPELELSWAEVIISVKNILQSIRAQKPGQILKPPFSDLPELHPLYDSAALAASLGLFKNLSQQSFLLSQQVKGLDALHVIVNMNEILK
ncbi:MAG: hypothetical protein JW956_04090 [Calditrichaceae bacterium]|nr:hypothetical protein [Calditrichaceae bacterium]